MRRKIIDRIKKSFGKILFPDFLDRIDNFCLLHQPRLWTLKLHYVFYYALLINIFLFGFIFTIQVYNLPTFFNVVILIITISEVIALVYWLYKQSIYNIEKEYGNTYKSNGFLEFLGYIACVMLILSATSIFYLSVALKSPIIIPQAKLSIDLLILNSINIYIDSKNSKDTYLSSAKTFKLNEYLKNFIVYNNQVIQKHINESIFSKKYDNEQERIKWISNFKELKEKQGISSNQYLQYFLLKNKLRDSLKDTIKNEKDLIFLEYNNDNNSIYTYSSSNPYPLPYPYDDKRIKIFKYLLNKNKEDIKNSILPNFLELIEKGNPQKIFEIIKYYTGQNISNQQSDTDIYTIGKAQKNANDIYEIFDNNNLIIRILSINYYTLDLIVLLLFLFKNTYWLDFIFALIYLFVIVVIFTSIASCFDDLPTDIKVIFSSFCQLYFLLLKH
ncbi:MAG: hypothetical protein V7K21_05575 [Nostoc sp.]|uniref:hypothetical protein n=1 Tax=Nostoc sp. TaxID=1180 RepID=UPI002FF74E46